MDYIQEHKKFVHIVSIIPVLLIVLFNYLTFGELSNKLEIDEKFGDTAFYNFTSMINLVVGIATTLLIWVLFSLAVFIGLKLFSNQTSTFSQVLRTVAISFTPLLLTTIGVYIITKLSHFNLDLSNIQDFQNQLDQSNYKKITADTRMLGYIFSSVLCFFLIKWRFKLSVWASLIIVYVPLLLLGSTFFMAQIFIGR
ncbi:YIP1 family protein [Mesobacillus maritimus]|uniref:YIP1 family protein n=1 Tax=Mesobacillus maritimus TaxID=1643336 RepID=A0ABS7K4V8_9BACI|nr:YIP1 family protein [Mesobacillus maritimus]MBY0097270.1 YIP1 family protein [Mesobacillus maritimus]